MKRFFIPLIAVIITIALVFSGYYFFNRKNYEKIKNNPIENMPKVVSDKQAFSKCMTEAYKNFVTEWNKNYQKSGINTHQANCNLPGKLADDLNKKWSDAKAGCYK